QRTAGNAPGQNWAFDFAPPAGYSGSLAPGFYNFSNGIGAVHLTSYPTIATSSATEEKIAAQIANGTLELAALQNRSFMSDGFASPSRLAAHLYGAGYTCSNTSIPCLFG